MSQSLHIKKIMSSIRKPPTITEACDNYEKVADSYWVGDPFIASLQQDVSEPRREFLLLSECKTSSSIDELSDVRRELLNAQRDPTLIIVSFDLSAMAFIRSLPIQQLSNYYNPNANCPVFPKSFVDDQALKAFVLAVVDSIPNVQRRNDWLWVVANSNASAANASIADIKLAQAEAGANVRSDLCTILPWIKGGVRMVQDGVNAAITTRSIFQDFFTVVGTDLTVSSSRL
eukprot:TRINITY_DN8745_c0_g1_i1.p1 TRINITY_DN8745_c0_g1~~TRINITY_DN8745_c0_g1_i1.p1  ORF type:complete len:231 (+),score=28.63 TRINITY_DN8745_c0_g1_i1:122-814(+)